ncbi:hypothetical protein PIB30_017538 [Stylosanthes scabra]|uniref:Uncharacterized protein n=1 Tax=Stylosanthes scabra TaxID=79078 RepID=A0ABU6S804_9FABA|nr:hypothetical protein [Stylosanthes scabra]
MELVRNQFLGPTKKFTLGPFLKVHLAKRLRNTELTYSAHTPAERPTCNMDEPNAEGHPGPPTERNLSDPTCPLQKGYDTIPPSQRIGERAPIHYSETSGHALFHHHHYRYTCAYKYPMDTQVLPPVSLGAQRLDSRQQPTLGADWTYLVLFSS